MKYNIFTILTVFTTTFLFSNCSSEDDFGEMEEMIATMAQNKMTRAAENQEDVKPGYKGEIILIKTVKDTLSKDLNVNGHTYNAMCNINVQIIIYEMIKTVYNPQRQEMETLYIHTAEVVPLEGHDERVEVSYSLEYLNRIEAIAKVRVNYIFDYMPDMEIKVYWNLDYNLTASDL